MPNELVTEPFIQEVVRARLVVIRHSFDIWIS
jgi:hypothetical protein